jgi:hypothetical protein
MARPLTHVIGIVPFDGCVSGQQYQHGLNTIAVGRELRYIRMQGTSTTFKYLHFTKFKLV